jgi:hypothetical protein
MGWFALSMDVHWAQVRGAAPRSPAQANSLRLGGAAALLLALILCLTVDSPSIAVLVWFMGLAGATLAIAFTLTWRASILRMLVFWTGPGGR